MEGKTCTKCKTEKAFSEFYRHKKGTYGYASDCKKCQSISGHTYRQQKHVKERQAANDRLKIRNKKKEAIYQKVWSKNQSQSLSDRYIAKIICNRNKVPYSVVIKSKPLIELMRANILLYRTIPDVLPVVAREVKPIKVKPVKVKPVKVKKTLTGDELECRRVKQNALRLTYYYTDWDNKKISHARAAKASRLKLTDGYVRTIIRKLTGVSNQQISDQMILVKRDQIMCKRTNKTKLLTTS